MVLFVDTVGVVGAGTMGSQIAEIFALNGKDVILNDLKREFVTKGKARVRASLDALAAFHDGKAAREIKAAEASLGVQLTDAQKTEAQKKLRPTYTRARVDEAYGRIRESTDVSDLSKAQLVIEAIVEEPKAKRDLFSRLQKVLDSRSVLATNTSSLSVTELAPSTGRPARFAGLHFFNPPTTLPLVEVIPGKDTDPETMDDLVNTIASLRNHRYPMLPVVVKDAPGFLVNRILGAMLREAYACLEEKIASARDIDKAMKAGAGLPMGPLELSDLIGLDIIQHAAATLKAKEGAYSFVREPTVVSKLVMEGNLGRKTGRGFFEYSKSS